MSARDRYITVSMYPPPCLADFRTQCDLAYFKNLLEIHDGSIQSVANAAGMRRTACYDKLRRLGLVGLDLPPSRERIRGETVKSWDSPELARSAAKLLREILGETAP